MIVTDPPQNRTTIVSLPDLANAFVQNLGYESNPSSLVCSARLVSDRTLYYGTRALQVYPCRTRRPPPRAI